MALPMAIGVYNWEISNHIPAQPYHHCWYSEQWKNNALILWATHSASSNDWCWIITLEGTSHRPTLQDIFWVIKATWQSGKRLWRAQKGRKGGDCHGESGAHQDRGSTQMICELIRGGGTRALHGLGHSVCTCPVAFFAHRPGGQP